MRILFLLSFLFVCEGIYSQHANDIPSTALPITFGQLTQMDNINATDETDSSPSPNCGLPSFGIADVYAEFTTSVGSSVDVDIAFSFVESTIELHVQLIKVSTMSQVVCLAATTGTNYSFNLENNTQYYLRFWDMELDNGSVVEYGDFDFTVTETTTPVNDDISNAIPLTINSTWTPLAIDYENATDEVFPTGSGCGDIQEDIWYSYVATDTECSARINSGNLLYWEIWEDDGSGGYTSIGCHPLPPNGTIQTISGLSIGVTYAIRFYMFGASSAMSDLELMQTCSSPVNDEIANATSVTINSTWTPLAVDHCNATDENFPTGSSCNDNEYDIWYSFIATGTECSARGNAGDPLFWEIWEDDGSGGYTSISCLFLPPNGTTSTISGLSTGVTYAVRLYKFGISSAMSDLELMQTCSSPVNDEIANATSITINSTWTSLAVDHCNATDESFPTGSGCSDNQHDIWYSFIATDTECSARVNAGDPLYWEIWEDDGSGGYMTLGCFFLPPVGTISTISGLSTGVTYVVRLYKFNTSSAMSDLELIQGGTLPVELISFQATRNNQTVNLDWQTATETNNAGFEIQKSNDAFQWQKLDWVEGKGTTSSRAYYEFKDGNPFLGSNYYRLKQVDFDGAFEYSEVVSIRLEKDANELFFFPNPVSDLITIHLPKSKDAQDAIIQIKNLNGQVVKEIASPFNAELLIDVSTLPSGVYLIRINHMLSSKFVKM